MTRFIHTADLHIGRSFASRFAPETASRLRAARVGIIDRLSDLAQAQKAAHVVVAGDFFDAPYVAAEDRRQAAEAMAENTAVTWWVLPGNHDPAASPVWDAWRDHAPVNFRMLDTPTPVEIEPGVWILPAPISGAPDHGDPTAVWDSMSVPEGSVRIGVGHGSVQSFGSSVDPNAIDPKRAARLGLVYAALGDWHGQKTVAPGVAYAGTPEADGFGAVGQAFVVDVANGVAKSQSVATGALVWHETRTMLPPSLDVDGARRFVQESRPEGRARASLWRWLPTGRASVSARAALESAFTEAAPGFFHASVDWSGVLPVYAPEDAARLAPEGALRTATQTLMTAAANGPDPVADRALSLLASALEGTS